MDVALKVSIDVAGMSLDDLIEGLTTIRERAAGSDVTVDYNSYEIELEWSESL